MTKDELFERNMLALSSTQSIEASILIRNAQPGGMKTEWAKDGSIVPVLEAKDGRSIALHSRYNPQEQAKKLASTYGQQGFYVFLGLGGGYEILSILQRSPVSRGIIIEYDAAYMRELLSTVDLTPILADRRLSLCVDMEETALVNLIAQRFVPAVTGNLVTVPLRARVDADPERFTQAVTAVRKAMAAASDDYSVQAYFGKRWFANIIHNLEHASRPTPPVMPIREAIISAAGPSLDDALDTLKNRSRQQYLIATDTSLRALLSYGIQPDALVSIDCQHISYYHFMDGCPPDIPVFFDLASPPTVTRLAKKPYFFSSGHPLARYLSSQFRAFPSLDTSGGNVTHAAVSLAVFLGASRITVYGADFSYPLGSSYARGTYIYPYFDRRQNRLRPQEALFSEFLYRNQQLIRQEDSDGFFRYLTKPLIAYHERLSELRLSSLSSISRVQGRGLADEACTGVARADRGTTRSDIGLAAASVFSSGPLFKSARGFLEDYLDELQGMKRISAPASSFMDTLTHKEKDIWTTLLPVAAAIQREYRDKPPTTEQVLEETRLWCMGIVRSELDA